MKKRILSMLMAVVMVLSLVPSTVFADTVASGSCGGEGDGSNLTWILDDVGALTISGTGKMKNFGSPSSVPWYSDRSSIKSVTIGNSVTSIGDGAFYDCDSLTSVTIPDSVTSIGDDAFCDCDSLTSVTIPDSVTSIGDGAFRHCESLTSVTIPDSVTSIGDGAFYYCDSLTSVTIPNSVTSIGGWAFWHCKSLTNVTIGNSVTSIGDYAFYDCYSLTSVTIPDSVTSIGDWGFAYCSSLTSVTIPDSVTSIGDGAFEYCDSLTSVTIPDSVTSIGDHAFYACGSLTSVTIPDSVTSIGNYAFYACKNLADVYYSGSEAQWKQISINSFNECLTNAAIRYNWVAAKFHITSITPNRTNVGKNEVFFVEFNQNVQIGTGSIHINVPGKSNSVTSEYYSIPVSRLTVSGNMVTVDISKLELPEGSYYVTINPGAFVSARGDKFYGLNDKTTWEFDVDYDYNTEVPMKYAKKGHLFWKTNDKTKPGIPNGSDSEYAAALYKWAMANGIHNLSEQQLRKMLDEPMYFTVTDVNGSTVMLNDKSTTVRQAMNDILFFENLKPFVDDLDSDLSDVVKYNSLGKVNAIAQETDIYENVLGWYSQIHAYLEKRNSNSNLFYSAVAPLAYKSLLMATDAAGISGYSYVKPIIEAELQSSMLEASMNGLQQYSNYNDFKNASKDIGTILKSGKAIYKARVGEGSAKSFVNLGAGMLQTLFADVNNSTLNKISKSWSMADSAKSAADICVFVGSSIGAFPMLIDLYNKGFTRISNAIAASYFIGDYYVSDKYPEIFDLIYADGNYIDGGTDEVGMWYAGVVNTDPIIYNWNTFLYNVVKSELNGTSRQLRYDLYNYAMLLQYAREYDASAVKSALVRYLSAECNKQKTTQFYTSCPVRVEVYDKNTDELLASLSSTDDSIEENAYCSMYLMGDNNETKCFVLDSQDYYAIITPYADGTMDISVIATDENGDTAGKTFNAVELTEGESFVLGLDDMDTGLETHDGNVIEKESHVPVTSVEITGNTEIAVGESVRLTAKVLPVIASDCSITWSSSDESVAMVSEDGTVTAVSEGEAIIYAASPDGVTGERTVNVFVKATDLSTEAESLRMVKGESYDLSATVSDGATHNVRWTSEDLSIVTVDSNGHVYAKEAGTTLVTASVDGIENDIFISVSDDILETELYQLDGTCNALKIDLTNNSCVEKLEEQGFIAVYESGRLLKSYGINIDLAAGEKLTEIVLVPDFEDNKTYSVAFVPVGEKLHEQPTDELVLINSDFYSEKSTEAATTELSGCQLANVGCSDLIAGEQYTLYVITGNDEIPSAENLLYIGRKQSIDGTIEFAFGLNNSTDGEQYHAYLQLPDGTIREMEMNRPNADQHTYIAKTAPATCTEKGYTTYTCACGESYEADYADEIDHEFINGVCVHCGQDAAFAPGDITGDGSVNALDLMRLKKYLAGEEAEVKGNADVTGDGSINALDLMRLKKYLAGEGVELY